MERLSIIYTLFDGDRFVTKNNGHSAFLKLYGIDLSLYQAYPVPSIISTLNEIFKNDNMQVDDVKYLSNTKNQDQSQLNNFKKNIERYWTKQGYTLDPNIAEKPLKGDVQKRQKLLDLYEDVRTLTELLESDIEELNARKIECNEALARVERLQKTREQQAEAYISELRDKMIKAKANHKEELELLNHLDKELETKRNEKEKLDSELRAFKNEHSLTKSQLDSAKAELQSIGISTENILSLRKFTKEIKEEWDKTFALFNKVRPLYEQSKFIEIENEVTALMARNAEFMDKLKSE